MRQNFGTTCKAFIESLTVNTALKTLRYAEFSRGDRVFAVS